MVRNRRDWGPTIDESLEQLARLFRFIQSHRWKNVHPVSRGARSEEIVVGLATKRWLPSPHKSVVATLLNWAERQNDPILLQGIAAIVQRAAIGDPEFKACLLDLSTLIEDTGTPAPRRASVAVQAQVELDRLLKAGPATWSTLEEILGDEHCLPGDLLNQAWWRLAANRESWCDVLTVIHRLRKAMGRREPVRLKHSSDPFWQKYGWTWVICRTLQHLLIFREWTDMIGLSGDDLEALKVWVQRLDEEDPAPPAQEALYDF